MKVQLFPGFGCAPDIVLDPFHIKNVRIIGDLNKVAARIHKKIARRLITEPFLQEVCEPFPYENGLGYFVKVTLDATAGKEEGRTQGFFFCLTGDHRRRWAYGVGAACVEASGRIVEGNSADCDTYVHEVKKALDLT